MTQTTDTAILEALILYDELSLSKLALQTGLSYPTVLSRLRTYPFIKRRVEGRETRVSVDKRALDAVFHFLMAVVTSPVKKGTLALAYDRRKNADRFLLGGQCALQMQLYVKDADPAPVFEIRSSESKRVRDRLNRLLEQSAFSENPTLEVVRDRFVRPELSTHVGLIPISRPEKIMVDALSERNSEVYIDQIVESISNSKSKIDFALLKAYADERGVLNETMARLESAGLTFP
jgi:hypothetical protein